MNIQNFLESKQITKHFLELANLPKKHKEILDKINHLINVDLYPHINISRSKNKFIVIDTSELNDLETVNIERIGNQYDLYRVAPNGVDAIALILK